jgi:two-component system response regulator VicR
MISRLIMVIDNEGSILDIMSIILKQAKYDVIIHLEPPPIPFVHSIPDLILLDIGPYNKHYKSYFDLLKSNVATMSIPVILMSTLEGLESVAKNWRADAFLSKPFDIDFLVSQVNSLLV